MPDIRPLPDELAAEVTEFQEYGAELLDIAQSAPPAEIVRVIKEKLGAVRDGDAELDEGEIVGLGVLLGEQYVRRFGWHWAHVKREEVAPDRYYVCVLPKDNRLSINPINWVSCIVSGASTNNVLLNFNMVAEGKVPRAAVNEALGFH